MGGGGEHRNNGQTNALKHHHPVRSNLNLMTLEEVPPEPERGCNYVPESRGKTPRPNYRASLIKGLRNIQRYSAYGVATFAGLHLTTTVVLPSLSTDLANSMFMASRSVYQSDLGEMVLVYGSFGVHIVSGLALHAYRIYKQYTDYGRINFGRPSNTAISGLVLTVFASLHFISTRYGPLIKLGDSSLISLDYISWALHYSLVETGGSLAALVFLFSAHSINGASQYFKLRLKEWKKWLVISGFTTLAFASLTALFKQPEINGWIGEQFQLAHSYLDEMYIGKLIDLVFRLKF